MMQSAAKALDNRKQFDVVYAGPTKAFDRVEHHILLEKLDKLGVRLDLLKLLRFFCSIELR